MTQKAEWRLAHIAAAILGAILMALTARHALVFNSPDLRTGAFAISSMAAVMVGVILLVRFYLRRPAGVPPFESRTWSRERAAMSLASC